MLATVEGVYRHGRIELTEVPADIQEETIVIVTFLHRPLLHLSAMGITRAEAVELRGQLASFREDWEHPDMDVYDDYDAVKANL
jgi:hypothetical protein